MRNKHYIGILAALALLVGGLLAFLDGHDSSITPPQTSTRPTWNVIGVSVEGRAIESFTFGRGVRNLMFVGGIHGGYEWNSVALAYQALDYLTANPGVIPDNLSVTIIPSANPDGVFKAIERQGRFTPTDVSEHQDLSSGVGRFNAHGVDLNRNFDCNWKPESMWKSKTVSAGTSAFSEPETSALRDLILKMRPVAVIFWHSQANAVYASECNSGILPETLAVMNAYATASGYPAVKSFDAYAVSGDAEGWLASIGIPAITVELKTHETVEWEKNLRGIKALLDHYGSEAE